MEIDFQGGIRKPHIQLIVLFVTLALALLTNKLFGDPKDPLSFLSPLFGLLVAIEIFYFVTLEVKEGAQKHGWKHEVVDTLIALGVAVAIWFGAQLILGTSTPISAVVSCSMLPNLQRGDFVIVQGAPAGAYGIEMSEAELDSIYSSSSDISYGENRASLEGSLFSYCVTDSKSDMCRAFVASPESFLEKKGPFTYRYERCGLAYSNGSQAYMPCLKSVEFKGTQYLTNLSHDVIVYQPVSGDPYSAIGDIVHRAFFRIDADGKTYYLTRGDNNPILDLQVFDYRRAVGNHPVPQENTRGKVIARIPFLGYFKLFISGFFSEDSQCRTQLDYTNV
ncbi:MAG: hypothetical protein V1827_00365 [Candidatus Micrarchaeota archaeon]